MDTSAAIQALSSWIDRSPHNKNRDIESKTWGRLAKIGEEYGEVIAAYIGVTSQNPRKGMTHTMDDVRRELFDVALTALCAYAHCNELIGGDVMELFDHFVANNVTRAAQTKFMGVDDFVVYWNMRARKP